MSKPIIETALRVSDYLERQSVKQKERLKEKMLTILPSYLEQQISGVKDKKTLYNIIPQLSAEMYTYGPEVGNAANQILGNMATTKFREIGDQETQAGYQSQVDALVGQVGPNKVQYGDKDYTVGELLGKWKGEGMSAENISKNLPGVVERGMYSKGGLVEEAPGGKAFYQQWETNKLGTHRQVNRFEIDKKSGMMDDLSTPEAKYDTPTTPEVTAWRNKLIEDERNAKQQLSKSITLAKFNQDYQFAKMEEMDLNKIRALRYYDMDTKEQVKADKDESGTPYFYTEKDEEIVMPGFGMNDIKVKTGKKIRVPVKDVSKLQEIGQFPEDTSITNADIDQASQNANRTLQMLGEKLIEKGEDRNDYVGANGFFLRDKVLGKAKDSNDPEVKKLLDAYTAKEKEAYDKTVGTISNETPSIFKKKN